VQGAGWPRTPQGRPQSGGKAVVCCRSPATPARPAPTWNTWASRTMAGPPGSLSLARINVTRCTPGGSGVPPPARPDQRPRRPARRGERAAAERCREPPVPSPPLLILLPWRPPGRAAAPDTSARAVPASSRASASTGRSFSSAACRRSARAAPAAGPAARMNVPRAMRPGQAHARQAQSVSRSGSPTPRASSTVVVLRAEAGQRGAAQGAGASAGC
jgi:hypothetical protein